MDFYSMTSKAIAQELGKRIEQIRLEQNMTQQQLADEIGLSRVSYRKLTMGQAKFENIISVLRILGKLDLVERFIPEITFSPMELLKLQGKKRQRAKPAARVKKHITDDDATNKTDEELGW
jgi:putative transcriptional regulator